MTPRVRTPGRNFWKQNLDRVHAIDPDEKAAMDAAAARVVRRYDDRPDDLLDALGLEEDT